MLKQELEEKCKTLNLDDMVDFLGWVPNAASKLLPCIDVFVQPSLWEANSIVLLEAMAMGVPIVANEVGDCKHIIDDGVNGFITQPKNSEMKADVLEKLSMNEKLAEQIGKEAKMKFDSNYTIDKMITEYEKKYIEMLNG
jgi:glycosyltransferase involved in cell wall biosynthesis